MTTTRELLARYVTQSQMSSFFIDKMGIINVKSYGAKGDGVTDDTNAIQAALDALNASGGGTLYFPPGIYVIGTALTLYSNITICGDKHRSILYMKDNSSINMLYALSKSNITVKEITIDGNKANNPFSAWPDTASQGIYFSKCSDIFISNVIFKDNYRAVCCAGDNTQKVSIANCYFSGSDYAIDNYGTRMTVADNIFNLCTDYVIQIEPTVDSPYINYDSGDEDNFYGAGEEKTYAAGVNINNNIINGGAVGITIHPGSYDVIINGNNIQNITSIGIFIKNNTTRINVTNNIIRNVTTNSETNPENPWQQTGSGITVLENNCQVSNNFIEFCHTGIYVDNPRKVIIKNNNIQRCRTSPICVYGGNKDTIINGNYCFGSPTYENIGSTYYGNGGIILYYCSDTCVLNNIVVGDRLGKAYAAVVYKNCRAIKELNNQGIYTKYRTSGTASPNTLFCFGNSKKFGWIAGSLYPKYGIYETGSIVFCGWSSGYPTMLICTSGGGGYSAEWAATTSYDRGVWVKTASGKIIIADLDGGTSGETNPDDLEIEDGTCKWKMSTGASTYWQPSTSYNVGDKVKFSDELSYECTQAGTSGQSEPEGVFTDNEIEWRYMAENAASFINSVNGQNGYRTSSGAPSLTPYFIGEEVLDTANGKWYKAKGLTSSDWVALN